MQIVKNVHDFQKSCDQIGNKKLLVKINCNVILHVSVKNIRLSNYCLMILVSTGLSFILAFAYPTRLIFVAEESESTEAISVN